MTERLRITSIGHRGDGLADGPEGAIYVPYTLPGETVDVDAWPGNHPDRRHLIHVVEESGERIAPICPHFGVCGGCAIQHWRTDRYRAWKRGLVVEALAQAGIATPVDDLVDAHGEGRRRAVFHGRRGTHDVLNVGFSALRAHEIIPIDRCPIFAPGLDGAIEAAWAIAEALDPTGKPLDIHATASTEGLDIDVRGSGPLKPDRIAALARVVQAHRLARLTRHGELIAQRAPPTVTMGKARLRLPPGVFLQATAAGEEELAARILAHVGKARNVADLFAGVGPFALRLAEGARVTAIDSDAAAVAALTQAAATPGLKPITAIRRDLFRTPMAGGELTGIDAAVFDPPRQGGEAQARALAASKVSTVVAVSCNPATFARDARILIDGGYRLESVTPLDQFRYSAHVEIVAAFRR